MTKPASYPFLAIAKRYGLDYGDVLLVADMWRHPARRSAIEKAADQRLALVLPAKLNGRISMAVSAANAEFKAIQDGHIDWLTGEPVELAPPQFPGDKLKWLRTP